MKVLLAATMTIMLTGTAFGACAPGSTKECTKTECEGIKYVWNEKAEVKCMSSDGPVATNCAEGDSAGRSAKGSTTVGATDSTPTGKGAQK